MFSDFACGGICSRTIWDCGAGFCYAFCDFPNYVNIGITCNHCILYVGIWVDLFYNFPAGASDGICIHGRVFCRSNYSDSLFPGKDTEGSGNTTVCVHAKRGAAHLQRKHDRSADAENDSIADFLVGDISAYRKYFVQICREKSNGTGRLMG